MLSVFKDDVRKYLDDLGIIYTPDFISKGTTGFDFQIEKNNEEIVIKSFNKLDKSNLPNFLFAWEDIKPAREAVSRKNIRAVAIINDHEKKIKSQLTDALTFKEAGYIKWSKRYGDKNKEMLLAA